MSPGEADITQLLSGLRAGDPEAQRNLVPLVYAELRRQAARFMRSERKDHTLQPTALVNEVYLRLVEQKGADWQSRAHFFAFAARLMRQVLVDYARGHNAAKRGSGVRDAELDDSLAVCEERRDEILAVDETLNSLREVDARQAQIVELRFFAGLSIEEIAAVLNVSDRTVKRDWTMARAWMRGRLSGEL